jgi:chaperonin GroEL
MVPGGGVALLNTVDALKNLETQTGDETTGVQIVRRSLEEPIRQLAANAGEDGSVIVQNIRRTQTEKGSDRWGFDVMSGEYVDLFEVGIMDPAKVTRSALENAASIASMILTTEALITDIPEKEPAMPGGGPGGMGGMDY